MSSLNANLLSVYMAMTKTLILLVYLFRLTSGLNYSQKVANYATLLSMYENTSTLDMIPLQEFGKDAMAIKVNIILYSLNDFDEIAGKIELAIALNLSWTDQIVPAMTGLNTSDVYTLVNGSDLINSLMVPYDKIWTPKIVLYESIDTFTAIGDLSFMCRYFLRSGEVTWRPKVHVNSACSPDVMYYPFDRQTCSISFVPWGFTIDEIEFTTDRYEWDLSSFEMNGEWDIVETQSLTEIRNNQSHYKLTIIIQRRSLYFAFNIILPVLALSILNGMVFWLPVESGERVGFSITCFLSFMVLLYMIMDILPRSSSPMSYLCYYVVVMMLFSGLMTVLVILQMRLYHKPQNEKVPVFLQKCVNLCRFERSKSMRESRDKHAINKVSASDDDGIRISDSIQYENEMVNTDTEVSTNKDVGGRKSETDITWQTVGNVFDLFLFLGFLAVQIVFSGTLLLPLGYRALSNI